MSGHTPGPWHVAGSVSWNGAPIVALDSFGNDIRVATMSRNADKPIQQKEADARLISSAPALLEALKGLVGLECPITVKDPFGPAVVAHWTEQKAQGHGYAYLYLDALAAIALAEAGQ